MANCAWPATMSRGQTSGKINPLTGWITSVHNTATNKLTLQANVGKLWHGGTVRL